MPKKVINFDKPLSDDYLREGDRYDLCGQLIVAFGGSPEDLKGYMLVSDYHEHVILPDELLFLVKEEDGEYFDAEVTDKMYTLSALLMNGIDHQEMWEEVQEVLKQHLPDYEFNLALPWSHGTL